MQRSAVPVEGIEFVDKFGDTRVVHHAQYATGPLRVKRLTVTPALALNQPVAIRLGQKVRELRLAQGWSAEELAERAGLRGGKQTTWRIENALRGSGVRLGTLYALAMALDVEVADLMPSVADVSGIAKPQKGRLAVALVKSA